jgi:hypothetical protein
MAQRVSKTTRLANAAVMSAWSYGGLTSTTSRLPVRPQRAELDVGTGAVGGAAVEGRAQDHDVGVGIAGLVVKITFGHAEEGEVRTELGTVARHQDTRFSCGRMACADS